MLRPVVASRYLNTKSETAKAQAQAPPIVGRPILRKNSHTRITAGAAERSDQFPADLSLNQRVEAAAAGAALYDLPLGPSGRDSFSPVNSSASPNDEKASGAVAPLLSLCETQAILSSANTTLSNALASTSRVDALATSSPSELPQIRDLLQSTRFKLDELLSSNGLALEDAEAWVKDDLELVKLAISNNPRAFSFASERLRTKPEGREIIKIALQKSQLELEKAPEWVKDDEELVKEAIDTRAMAFKHASDRLKRIRMLMELAVEKNPLIITYVPLEELEANEDVVFRAIRKNANAYASIVKFFKNDALKIRALEASGLVLKYIPHQVQTLEMVLTALANTIKAFDFVRKDLQSHSQVMHLMEKLKQADSTTF